MGVDLIFRVATIGILVAIVNAVLEQTGRKEMTTMTTLLGMILVLAMVAEKIGGLFETVKTMFQF